MKVYILGLMSILLIGCASGANTNMHTTSSHVGSVTNFASAIRAYDASQKIEYLKEADKYAVSENEKAILESRMVDYLGADKVFDVKITNSLGAQKGFSSSGFFQGDKGSNQNIKLLVNITPKKNLPFTLKYNKYRVFLGVKQTALYAVKSDVSRQRNEKINKNYTVGTIELKPSNQYRYTKTLHKKIMLYGKTTGFLNTGKKMMLQKLEFSPIIDIYPNNAVLKENGITWQNYYPFTTGHYVKLINTKYAFSEDVAEEYCKNLTIDGGGWRLPTEENLRVLSSSKISKDLVGTQDEIGKELYYSSDFDNYWGYKWRISDFDKKKLSKSEKYTPIRCKKYTQASVYDKNTGLEWDNQIRYSNGDPDEFNKICQKKGKGWRLPTPNEYSYMIKNHTVHFIDKPGRYDKYWTTSKWKRRYNEFTLVSTSGDIKSASDNGNIYRCVRRR